MKQWLRDRKNRSGIKGSQQMYRDVMLDIETTSTNAFRSKILSLGAVRFRVDTMDDWESISQEDRTFYARLDTDEQEDRIEDEDTMKWWSEQSEEARAVFDEEPESVKDVLKRFTEFTKGAKRIWGNGNVFDNTNLRELYEDNDLEYPVEFWGDLDMRSFRYVWNKLCSFPNKGAPPVVKGIKGALHNALVDAKKQVMQMQKMYSQMRGTKYGA